MNFIFSGETNNFRRGGGRPNRAAPPRRRYQSTPFSKTNTNLDILFHTKHRSDLVFSKIKPIHPRSTLLEIIFCKPQVSFFTKLHTNRKYTCRNGLQRKRKGETEYLCFRSEMVSFWDGRASVHFRSPSFSLFPTLAFSPCSIWFLFGSIVLDPEKKNYVKMEASVMIVWFGSVWFHCGWMMIDLEFISIDCSWCSSFSSWFLVFDPKSWRERIK